MWSWHLLRGDILHPVHAGKAALAQQGFHPDGVAAHLLQRSSHRYSQPARRKNQLPGALQRKTGQAAAQHGVGYPDGFADQADFLLFAEDHAVFGSQPASLQAAVKAASVRSLKHKI
jgi:hypothetical protein